MLIIRTLIVNNERGYIEAVSYMISEDLKDIADQEEFENDLQAIIPRTEARLIELKKALKSQFLTVRREEFILKSIETNLAVLAAGKSIRERKRNEARKTIKHICKKH